jgi:nitrite reductase (NO-forming)
MSDVERNDGVDNLQLGEEFVPASDRRLFLKRAAGLGLAIPVGGFFGARTVNAQQTPAAQETPQPTGVGSGGVQSGTGSELPAPGTPTTFTPMDPVLKPAEAGPKHFTIVAEDATVFVANKVAYAGWTFNGTIPSPPLRARVGDTVTLTVRNNGMMDHSLDTHAAQTPPDKNYPIVKPGQEYTWSFTPKHPGAFMYHCGTPPVLIHIASGMYGAMIIDPAEDWPPAQELVFVQSEFYLKDGENGVKTPDFTKMLNYGPLDYVAFNGYAEQYVQYPINVKVGEPIRIFVVNAGPNSWSSFHVVGAIFDTAYTGGNPANVVHGVQSVSIGPGDGACVEFTLEEPGTYTAVNHAFGHAAHGAAALLIAK